MKGKVGPLAAPFNSPHHLEDEGQNCHDRSERTRNGQLPESHGYVSTITEDREQDAKAEY